MWEWIGCDLERLRRVCDSILVGDDDANDMGATRTHAQNGNDMMRSGALPGVDGPASCAVIEFQCDRRQAGRLERRLRRQRDPFTWPRVHLQSSNLRRWHTASGTQYGHSHQACTQRMLSIHGSFSLADAGAAYMMLFCADPSARAALERHRSDVDRRHGLLPVRPKWRVAGEAFSKPPSPRTAGRADAPSGVGRADLQYLESSSRSGGRPA